MPLNLVLQHRKARKWHRGGEFDLRLVERIDDGFIEERAIDTALDGRLWQRLSDLSYTHGHDGARHLFDAAGSAGGSAGAAPAETGAARAVAAQKSVTSGVYGPTWLLEQNPGYYMVQIAALASADAAKEHARQPGVAGELAYFDFSRDGKQLYPVLYGSFPDRAEAERVVAGLPPRLRESRPWIRRFEGIQKTTRRAPGD